MATLVLVHGAWHGAWCFRRLEKLLQADGHRTLAQSLTGLADRKHLLTPQIGLTTHIADVANLILTEDLHEVILVGHSYGGYLISAVADQMPGRIAKLVYLDAFVPNDGESLSKYISPKADDQYMPPLPAKYFNVNTQDQAWVDSQCTLHPTLTWREPIKLTALPGAEVKQVQYIRATGWTPTFDPDEARAQKYHWTIDRVNCGHDVMLDEPELLAKLLLKK